MQPVAQPTQAEGERSPICVDYKIVTFKRPIQWTRSDDEVWMFNPPRRYILNANHLERLRPHIDTISDLRGSRHYRPLRVGAQLRGAKILVERCRDRGIGDMLFMTGPLSFIQHLAGGHAHIDMYGLVDRSVILQHHPALAYAGTLAGPVEYDDLPHYQYHWFVDAATENDETRDQLNVYDALYKQLGIDPNTVNPRFKRPSMTLVQDDYTNLDSLYYMVMTQRGIDLRMTPYYVLAPISYSSLRVAPYALWLSLAQELSKVRPVIFAGHVAGDGQMPSADMTFGAFYQQIGNLGQRIVNLMGNTSLRVVAALISRATCVVTLDSGLLYVAQAIGTPAVSLWGTHSPTTRIGYDQAYLRYAIHKRTACPASPCYAYAGFPYSRCPRLTQQLVCEPLVSVVPSDIVAKVTEIEEAQRANAVPVEAVKAESKVEPPAAAPSGP
jgi:hypothetical protein